MKKLIGKIRIELFELFGGPNFHSFKRKEVKQDYDGLLADLFYSNTGEPVHKWPHYLPIYEKLLEDVSSNIKFLEIGVYRGGSLKLWREYFGPDATIFGVDIDPSTERLDGVHGEVRVGSQADPQFLQEVVSEMGGVDVILDDGSHVASHQKTSFETLFPLLNEGGLYIIEDLHTSYWPTFEGGLKKSGTAIEFLKEKIDKMHKHYWKVGHNTADKIPKIESIQFFDSIAAIKKATQKPRYTTMVPNESAPSLTKDA